MAIEICAVGGYNEVGKNMTAIKVDDDVVILDMGVQLDNYIKLQDEREGASLLDAKALIKNNAVPNDKAIEKWKDKVKLIICTHAHLDHLGAIPYLAEKYDCPIMGTPYTMEVLKTICKENKLSLKNPLKPLNKNSQHKVSDNLTVEFISVTHSTPQTVLLALHTKEGTILYANDYKFDMFPVMEKKTNFNRLKELDKVRVLIVESLYANEAMKMPSESVAKAMLKDVILGTSSEGRAIIISTFSSHLARLSSIIKYSKQLDRKIMFVGRSLAKYVEAGEKINLINFTKDVEVAKYGSEIKRKLKKVEQERDKYVIVATGHQGEPKAALTKIADDQYDFKLRRGDHVIFSCRVIPAPINMANRKVLEKKLADKKVRMFKDIHVSGHGAREDLRDLMAFTRPGHIIPTHGDIKLRKSLADLAISIGYELKKNVHLLKNGQKIKL
ncbi:ribonuclease J [Candidatus Woesearchaeota archaeon]|nr:ribonuclease J [Candidatus Woesearchaeota archaeon]MBW3014538.1 ribonuclease J [Candidatus Woesearchaeota archaeon]